MTQAAPLPAGRLAKHPRPTCRSMLEEPAETDQDAVLRGDAHPRGPRPQSPSMVIRLGWHATATPQASHRATAEATVRQGYPRPILC